VVGLKTLDNIGYTVLHRIPLVVDKILRPFGFAQYHVCCAAMPFRHDGIGQWNCGTCVIFWR
jgi:hypothetical protein